ncbi:hypothetical protein COC69_25875 [Bacillus cereus]|uniref:Uncharacterized protein n=1 Tax=Bacillus cereus TaxID=1396 RepID=A0A9X7GTP6_BACCE|nr:hypothetical protein COC69_25875 [Bacillus cereus]
MHRAVKFSAFTYIGPTYIFEMKKIFRIIAKIVGLQIKNRCKEKQSLGYAFLMINQLFFLLLFRFVVFIARE